MRKTVLAAASIIVLGLGAGLGGGTTAAMAQIHGGHGGGGMGGHVGGGMAGHGGGGMAGHIGGGMSGHVGGGPHLGAMGGPRIGGAAPGAMAARPNMAAAPNNFAAGNRGAVPTAPNTFAFRHHAGRGAYAWRGDHRYDRFHHRRFAFFPGFYGGVYDYAGPTCYYDPNAPWTYNPYGYNCYSNDGYSYNWVW